MDFYVENADIDCNGVFISIIIRLGFMFISGLFLLLSDLFFRI